MGNYRYDGKRTALVGLLPVLVLLIIGWGVVPARAEVDWFTCRVNLSGPGSTQTYVNLTDLADHPAFVDRWFLVPAGRGREMLAVALTAINSGRRVLVQVDPESGDEDREAVLHGLYLMAEPVAVTGEKRELVTRVPIGKKP